MAGKTVPAALVEAGNRGHNRGVQLRQFNRSLFVASSVLFGLLLAATVLAVGAQRKDATAPPSSTTDPSPNAPQTVTTEGISIEFSVDPLGSSPNKPAQLLSGTEATVRFRIADANGGKALTNLRPAGWIDLRESDKATEARECREKVQSFLQQSFSKRPSIDLNSYFILTLNNEANISVIDPLSGFGGSKLYMLIALRAPGEDWVLSADNKKLYVSMPQVNQVAVIDTVSWNVIGNIETGRRPARVALQNDGRYLWVGTGASDDQISGVTVIDTVTSRVAAQLNLGRGHHEIAFAEDDSLAFVTSRQDGTLSVVDIRRLAKIGEVKVGALPSGLAYSPLSKALYVASEGDGTIVAVDAARHEVLARMKALPGLGPVRMVPDSRFGFVINKSNNVVFIFDASSNRIAHAVPVGRGADQLAFTRQFAYVRCAGSEFVDMIKLADLGKEVAVTHFPAGQKAPIESALKTFANAIVPAPEEGAVLVANPADKMIYYYSEGMAAPMGTFQNYRRDPRALLVLDNSIRETAQGVYTTTVRLGSPGRYDVAFLLDSPRVVNCFEITVAQNPAQPKETGTAIKVELLETTTSPVVGENYTLRFRVLDAKSNQPRPNIADVGVLIFLPPGTWNKREWARASADGVYEVSFVPPQTGVYYFYFRCPSLGVEYNKITPLTLHTVEK
jgi:YVTN family beta-propeller protein